VKGNRAIEKIRVLFKRFETLTGLHLARFLRFQPNKSLEKSRFELKEPRSLAYQLIGDKTERFLPLFRDLESNLRKSGLKINFRAYVSLTLFAAILASFTSLALVPSLLIIAFGISLLPAFLFGVGGGLLSWAFVVITFYVYPLYRADKLKRELEDELTFTTGYMAILSSAGVSPERIFLSLSGLSLPLAVSAEAKNIVRDVNLFGLDIISALEEVSKRTPSERFRETLEGFISTIHSGGNSAAFLREKSKQNMKLKRISLRKFSDTLSVLSEFYVSLLITGPLLMVIMLAVMAMLGGGGLGLLSPDLLLGLVTYMGIPLGSIMFLIILDAISPKW
jgi:flagellar protein FlaJ